MLALDEVTYAYGESAPTAHGESVLAEPSTPAASAARPVLSDVTLSLSPGEFVGIAGACASGKTTLLRLAAGRIAPTSGTVTVDGIASDATTATRRDITRIVSLCHQLPERQLFAKTLWADVAFGPANLGVDGGDLDRRTERALVSVGFDAARARQVSPFELSGGERRRAAIAGALAMEGRYLLLDEPTAGLDAASRDMLMGVLAERAASGTAVVVVSHDLELLAAHADRIVVLGPAALSAAPSTILADGPASEVLADAAMLERAGLVQPLLWRLADVLPEEFSPVSRPASGEVTES